MDFSLEIKSMGKRRVACLSPEGKVLAREADVLDVIGDLFGTKVSHVIVPKSRLSADFFKLENGTLGAMVQKFVNYHLTLVLVGDFSAEAKKSSALRDFIRESNQRKQPLFVGSMDGLTALLV
jgi:hypothetical protein